MIDWCEGDGDWEQLLPGNWDVWRRRSHVPHLQPQTTRRNGNSSIYSTDRLSCWLLTQGRHYSPVCLVLLSCRPSVFLPVCVCVCQSVCVFHCFVKLINVRKLTCPVCWENYLDARWARQRSEVWQPGRHQLLWQQHITVTVTFTISQGSEDTATGLRGGRPLVVVLLCEFMLLEKL